ncbi:MAG: Jag N-terminal domain-containing protein [Microthrixaceae bacterium]
MEWIETTGKTVADARELALDKLGVDESEAEFEVIEEPKSGLFGRTRGTARVRARVSPKAAPAKNDRKRRPKKRKALDRLLAQKPPPRDPSQPVLAIRDRAVADRAVGDPTSRPDRRAVQ